MTADPARSESMAARVVQLAPRLCRAIAYLAALLVVAPLAYHLARGSLAYLGLLEDDYFYYAIIADKLASVGKLTYDGTTLTNGFHPLWFLIVLALRLVAGGLNGGFYAMLFAAFLASMLVTYELARSFARALGASAALAPAIALVHCVATDLVVSTGMETAVDVPLLFWLLLELAQAKPVTPRRAAKLGFIASLAILARLDIALLVAIAFVGWVVLARPTLRSFLRVLAAFGAAGVAVPAYAAFNLRVFGTIMPVSAMAKQLVTHFGVRINYLWVAAFGTAYGKTAGLTLLAGTVALAILLRRRAHGEGGETVGRPQALFAGGLALAFSAIFFCVNTLNGWIFFGWYAYPFAPALVAALTFIGLAVVATVTAPATDARRTRAVATLVAAAAAVASVEAVQYFVERGPLWSVEDNGLLAMSLDLAARMRERPGVYGMGAIAGFATYTLNQPMVQLEGLVADRAMVEHIRHGDDLRAVLAAYHVDYLVISLHTAKMEKHDGCYALAQPNAEWSGKRVARMHGDICSEPIEHFVTRLTHHAWSVFSTLDTYVFDVRDLKTPSAT